jgi:hypothetical protein
VSSKKDRDPRRRTKAGRNRFKRDAYRLTGPRIWWFGREAVVDHPELVFYRSASSCRYVQTRDRAFCVAAETAAKCRHAVMVTDWRRKGFEWVFVPKGRVACSACEAWGCAKCDRTGLEPK